MYIFYFFTSRKVRGPRRSLGEHPVAALPGYREVQSNTEHLHSFVLP